jgi:hypothetical protein
VKRKAYILESDTSKTRHLCIDADNEATIREFLGEDEARIKKFRLVKSLILENIRNPELYDKEDIDGKSKNVTAIKMFKKGQNIRLYCKEQKDAAGSFYVIVAELLPKKKTQKNTGEAKRLINKVAGYEYQIVERNP